jgi:hypothetical protein
LCVIGSKCMKNCITDLFHASFDDLQNDQDRTGSNRQLVDVITDDKAQDEMASKAMPVSWTVRGSGSTSTCHSNCISGSEHVPVERRPSRIRSHAPSKFSNAADKASPERTSLRCQGSISSSRPHHRSSTATPRHRSDDRRKRSSTRQRPSETVNAFEVENGNGAMLVESNASAVGENKESRSRVSDRSRGRQSSEVLNLNAASSEVAMKHRSRSKSTDKPKTRRRSSESIIVPNNCDNAGVNLVKSNPSEGDNNTDSPSKSVEGTIKPSEFDQPSGGRRDKESFASKSKRGDRPNSPGDRMRAKSPMTIPKAQRRVRRAAAFKRRGSVPMLDGGWDDLSGDASPPSKLEEELRLSASSSTHVAEEAKPSHQSGNARPRRRAGSISRGPRNRDGHSSHGRSRSDCGESLLSKSNHKNPSRRRHGSLSQSTHASLKVPISLVDEDTRTGCARQEQTVAVVLTGHRPPPGQNVGDTKEQAPTASDGQPGHLDDEAALLHELVICQSVRTNLEARLDLPSVISSGRPLESHTEQTKHTSNLEALLSRPATSFTVMDAPSLDPPSACVHPVSQTEPIPQMKPGKKPNKLADLLNKRKPVTTFTLMDAPSVTPSSVFSIPLPSNRYNNKTPANSGRSTGLDELLSKKPMTTFTLDAPSVADPPSVSFHANPNAHKHKKPHGLKNSSMADTYADFGARDDLSKQSNPWATISWSQLAFDALAAESQKTQNTTA